MRRYSDMISKNDEGFFYKSVASALGLATAVIYKQIGYWCYINSTDDSKQETHFHDGKWWMYSSYKKFSQRDFPFISPRTIQRHIENLTELNLLHVGNFNKWEHDNTKWYAINEAAFDEFIAHWHKHKSPVRNGGQGQSDEYKAFMASWKAKVGGDNVTRGVDTLTKGGSQCDQGGLVNVAKPLPETTTETKSETTTNKRLSSRGDDDPAVQGNAAAEPDLSPTGAKDTENGVGMNAPAGTNGGTSKARSLSEYHNTERQREKAAQTISRNNPKQAQSRNNKSSSYISIDDNRMPEIGTFFLQEVYAPVVEAHGLKPKFHLTERQIEQLQERQKDGHTNKEWRSFEELYYSVPDMLKKWLTNNFLPPHKANAWAKSANQLVKRVTNYEMAKFGFASYLRGSGEVPEHYLDLDGHVITGGISQPRPPAPVDSASDEPAWKTDDREAVRIYSRYMLNGMEGPAQEIRDWILERRDVDLHEWLEDLSIVLPSDMRWK